jgi:hypothetical protein
MDLGENKMKDKKTVGVLILTAAGIFALASFLPWAIASDGFSQLNRNIYQMGANLSLDYNGFFALVWIALLAANGLNMLGTIRIHKMFQRATWWLPVGMSLTILNYFSFKFPEVSGVTWSQGAGVWLAIVAVIVVIFAAVKDRQGTNSEEHPEGN